ncbi:hypothetical protein BESB_054830 [Besnoitia besnoiti]|uniref:Serine/threonine protein phosphatase, related protein n=1 Tax=Besnoitia besnoiti TaxID=94643 RepID=A0A2A9MK96_BESBE|nr:hypothetical protein BESB_054830 [Besnoitia besnoiti]PFH35832.1 hypothetical protein BESB_054830 [Besnoitia besnoiti]
MAASRRRSSGGAGTGTEAFPLSTRFVSLLLLVSFLHCFLTSGLAERRPGDAAAAANPGSASFVPLPAGRSGSAPREDWPADLSASLSAPSASAAASDSSAEWSPWSVSASSVASVSLPADGAWPSVQSAYRIPIHMVGARAAVRAVSVGQQSLLLALDTQTEGVRVFLSNSTACTHFSSREARDASLSSPSAAAFQSLARAPTSGTVNDEREKAGAPRGREGGTRDGGSSAVSSPESAAASPAPARLGGSANAHGRLPLKALTFLQRRGTLAKRRGRRGADAGDVSQGTCYDPRASGVSLWCLNGRQMCSFLSADPFRCNASPQADITQAARFSQRSDGVRFGELRLEGLDLVRLELSPAVPPARGTEPRPREGGAQRRGEAARGGGAALFGDEKLFPVKLVADRTSGLYDVFPGIQGVFGIAGPEFCCRNASLWSSTLHALNVTSFAFDLNFPAPTALSAATSDSSRRQETATRPSAAAAAGSSASLASLAAASRAGRNGAGDWAPLSFLHLGVLDEGEGDDGGSAEARVRGFAWYGEAGDWRGAVDEAADGRGRAGGHGESDGAERDTPKKEGLPAARGTEVVWGERIQTGNAWSDSIAHFTSYQWEMCGSSLMGTSHMDDWTVSVDLSSECLVVPRPLWLAVRAWLAPALNVTSPQCALGDGGSGLAPVDAQGDAEEDAAARGPARRQMCPLRKPTTPANLEDARAPPPRQPLPALSFALRDVSGDVFDFIASGAEAPGADARVQLPLEQLVVADPDGEGEALCVVPQPHSLLSREGRSVRLGTRAVAAFHLIVDQRRWRVGLLPKDLSLSSSDASCATKATCKGQQTYIPALNKCADPSCSERLFFSLNEETKSCELSPFVVPGALTLLALLVGLEVAVVTFQWTNLLRARALT